MNQRLHLFLSAAFLFSAAGAVPATADDNQVGILEDGLRVPIEFWWKCVDDPASDPIDLPSGTFMCEDSDGWLVICDGDPTESACYLYPPGEHPGPGSHASTTTTTTTGKMTQAPGGAFGSAATVEGTLQYQTRP